MVIIWHGECFGEGSITFLATEGLPDMTVSILNIAPTRAGYVPPVGSPSDKKSKHVQFTLPPVDDTSGGSQAVPSTGMVLPISAISATQADPNTPASTPSAAASAYAATAASPTTSSIISAVAPQSGAVKHDKGNALSAPVLQDAAKHVKHA